MKTEIHTAGLLVPEPRYYDADIVIEKLGLQQDSITYLYTSNKSITWL
jgi:hypothetical protein